MSNGQEGLKEDVDLMTKSLEEGMGESTDAPATDAPAPNTDAPSTDQPKTEAPSTDSPATDSPATSPPPTDAPTTDAPVVDEKDEEIIRLKAELEELKGAKTTDAPTTDAPIKDQNFLDGVDFDEVRDDPEKFNSLLNKTYRQAVTDTRRDMTRSVPEMVRNAVAVQKQLDDLRVKFYEENKDLKPFGKVVAQVFGEAVEKNPNKTYDEVMKDLAPEVRKRLGIERKEVKTENKKGNKNNPPPLPRKKGSRNRTQTQSNQDDSFQSQAEEMNKSLGR